MFLQGSNWWYANIGAGGGYAPNRQQAITNDDEILRCTYT